MIVTRFPGYIHAVIDGSFMVGVLYSLFLLMLLKVFRRSVVRNRKYIRRGRTTAPLRVLYGPVS